MTEFFLSLGFPAIYTKFLFVPLLIIIVRILDVSLSTIRLLLVMNGKRNIAPFVGAIEVFIWIAVVGQIIKGENSMISYISYGIGFGLGTYIGMKIEEKMAIGEVMVQTVTQTPADELISYFKKQDIRFSKTESETNEGKADIIFAIVKRKKLQELMTIIRAFNPAALLSVSNIRNAKNFSVGYEKKLHKNRRILFFKERN